MSVEEIHVLASLEGVRRRPEMYVGDVAKPAAMNEVVEAVLCAAFDEALGGTCTRLDIEIDAEGVVTVRDDGHGMPVETCEQLFTTLYACRALRRDPRAAKRFCGGGIVVTNALSAWLEVEIRRAGREYRLRYERGVATAPLADVGACDGSGTTLRFRPDPEIFGDVRVDLSVLSRTLDEIRALAPETRVTLSASP